MVRCVLHVLFEQLCCELLCVSWEKAYRARDKENLWGYLNLWSITDLKHVGFVHWSHSLNLKMKRSPPK